MPYSSFTDIIQALPETTRNACETTNDRFLYLNDYLNEIGCKTIIIENRYVDKNFLDDYSGYYSRCFQDIQKKCVRVHLFSSEFDHQILKQHLLEKSSNTSDNILSSAYLGFIVLRPLPNAPLAKVCISTYPPANGKNRHFPTLKTYKAHLLGQELSIQSLAFQEQDRALSACATSALWSAFHGSSTLDVDKVSAPSRITENAKKIIPQHQFNHPHRGLTPAQMASSVREDGLEPLLCNFINTSYLKALVRAYLSVGVTPVLGMNLHYADESGFLENGISKAKPIGNHAVAVVGYNISDTQPIPLFKVDDIPTKLNSINQKDIYLKSSAIDKIYVHDDEIGPFAKMEFINEYWQHLKTRWQMYRDPAEEVNATVKDILLPKPHKIRISFNTVFSIIREFNSLYLKSWYDRGCLIIWDIYLTTVNDFKKEIRDKNKSCFNSDMHKIDILTLNLPRYLWRVDGYMHGYENTDQDNINFTLLFDATDIENSDIFICGIHYDLVSRIDIFLSVLNPLSELNIQKISKFSQSLRIAKEYSNLLTEKIIY